MNKYILFSTVIILCLTSIGIGYYIHESKDQIKIVQEAQKIIIERNTFNTTKLNISICGDDFNHGR